MYTAASEWNGRFHHFELVQNEYEGSNKYCCICSKEKVKNAMERLVRPATMNTAMATTFVTKITGTSFQPTSRLSL